MMRLRRPFVSLLLKRGLVMFLNTVFFLTILPIYFFCTSIDSFNLPELYQDVLICGQVVKKGVRECNDRYEAIKPVLKNLPKNFKSLDIGASQGYFTFRIAEEFQARCTMIEEGYSISNYEWQTGDLLYYLCKQNAHFKDLVLLQQKFYAKDLRLLSQQESFDVVLAFSVIHHMRKDLVESNATYVEVIDAILDLAPTVIIENPVNTGPHTEFIRKALQEKGGEVIYQSERGTLIYEIYLFKKKNSLPSESLYPDISTFTYNSFNGSYTSGQE